MSLVVSLLQQKDFSQARTLLSIDPSCIKVGIEQVSSQSFKSSRAHISHSQTSSDESNIQPKGCEYYANESSDKDGSEDPTIFYALGDVETLELLLLLAPQSAWAQNHNGERPLHAACQIPNVHEDVIDILLFAFPEGASAKNRDGKLALHFAVANIQNMNIIRIVYNAFPNAVAEKESKNFSKPLHYACAFKAPLVIVQFLSEKHVQAIELRNRQGNLPLHLCLMYDAPDDVKRFLISAYPNAVKMRDSKGRLPLHIAVQCQSISVQTIEALLEVHPESINDVVTQIESNDASTDTTINKWLVGKKSIHIALRFLSGRADAIRCLLSNSAFKEVVTKSALSSISLAVRKKAQLTTSDEDDKINIGFSGSASEDIDRTYFLNGDTILHTALEFKASIEVLETITSLRPSSLKEINNDGKLPIHFAAWRQVDPDTMLFLIRSFPESLMLVDEKTGNVALHYALQYLAKGNTELDTRMVEKVLSYMASACFVVNKAGFYPIHLAARAGCPYHIIDAMLKVVPYSFGLFSENRMRLLPIDLAIACKAPADVIGLLLGYPNKGDAINPKRITEDRNRVGSILANSLAVTEPTDITFRIFTNSNTEEDGSFSHLSTLMDAHLELQQKFTLQGEEMRKLRTRMHSIAGDLQSKNEEIKGYKRDVSWGKERIKLLEREISALTAELATFK
jgi:ankyrin repeat protein